jgi:hypothetical protein
MQPSGQAGAKQTDETKLKRSAAIIFPCMRSGALLKNWTSNLHSEVVRWQILLANDRIMGVKNKTRRIDHALFFPQQTTFQIVVNAKFVVNWTREVHPPFLINSLSINILG